MDSYVHICRCRCHWFILPSGEVCHPATSSHPRTTSARSGPRSRYWQRFICASTAAWFTQATVCKNGDVLRQLVAFFFSLSLCYLLGRRGSRCVARSAHALLLAVTGREASRRNLSTECSSSIIGTSVSIWQLETLHGHVASSIASPSYEHGSEVLLA